MFKAVGNVGHRFGGWDLFTPDAGECDSMDCRICGAAMKVKRGVNGPTSIGEAAIHKSHLHDVFTCRNSFKDWHNQVYDLRKLAEDSPSRFIVDQTNREIGYILKDRKPTLEKYTETNESSIAFKKKTLKNRKRR